MHIIKFMLLKTPNSLSHTTVQRKASTFVAFFGITMVYCKISFWRAAQKKVFSKPKILSWKGFCFDYGCLAAIFYSYSGGSSLPKREQLVIPYLQQGCMLTMLGIHLSFVKTFQSGNFIGN